MLSKIVKSIRLLLAIFNIWKPKEPDAPPRKTPVPPTGDPADRLP